MAKNQSKGKITIKQKTLHKGNNTPLSSKSKQEIKDHKARAPEESPETEFSDDTDSGLDEEEELGIQEGESDSEEEDEFLEKHSESEESSESDEDSNNHDPQNHDPRNPDSNNNSDNESDNESDSFPMRKKKKIADDGRQTFASAFNAIMGSKLKAYDRKDPILARNKAVSKELESSKLEARAKRALHNEKIELLNKSHVSELLPSADEPEKVRAYLEKEKALKKTAQRGVVKLFNAVMSSQMLASEEMDYESAGPQRKNELMTEVTKSTFLDMVKAAGEK